MLKRTLIFLILINYLSLAVASGGFYVVPDEEALRHARYRELFHKSLYLGVYQFALVYGLTKLPESVTKWTEEQRRFKNFGRNWAKHVSSSPVFDKDPLAVNYIGHPWGGAGYYCMARQTGLNEKEAFVYTLIQSTFVWEYGFEAMAERPSVQDLFVTPAVGTILGELKFREIQRIEANGGMVFGSKTAGSIAIALLSPYNALVEATRSVFNDTDNAPEIQANFMVRRTPTASSRYLFNVHFAV